MQTNTLLDEETKCFAGRYLESEEYQKKFCIIMKHENICVQTDHIITVYHESIFFTGPVKLNSGMYGLNN